MNNVEKHECDNCIWGEWCDIHDPNSELCGVYGNEVAYEHGLKERVVVYDQEILEYDDGRIEMF